MGNEKKEVNQSVALVGSFKLPKKVQDRLMDKMMEKNDDRIIACMEQRQSHIEAIKLIDKEIKDLTSLTGVE